MKLRLFYFATFVALMSCSDDDYTPLETKSIKSVTTFYNDGDEIKDSETFFYMDLPAKRYVYKNGQDFASEWFMYDAATMYLSSYNYLQENREDSLDKSIYYDEEGRIKTIYIYDYTPQVVLYTNTYDYSVNGEIRLYQQKDDNSVITNQEIQYSLNSMGDIYKITAFDSNSDIMYVTEAEYTGDVLTSVTKTEYQDGISGQQTTVNYNYNTSLEVKGSYLNLTVSQLGTNNNSILFYNGFEVFKDSYIQAYSNKSFDYELDKDNFPSKETVYLDGNFTQKNIITYK
ncbi:hypothetical protein GN157_05055 [Flavobacterium rakeshii]|uniref:DUF4595 domain-containing protein n=1 Tax=Flavobacterium rakeshii TaxID=1038845 RepID=A0A6N8H9U1_9FLAO|nr:hypothetical protein [Flavobacterium rakeshii]MUV03072.1 hypothetical protein [Flavobacterium rakeshii]